jgi:hypothetical protein
MKFPVRLSLFGAFALAAGAAGCSGSGGGGLLDYPGGTITLADQTTGAKISTSPTNPYIVPALQLRFTITATEARYDGPYNVQIINQTNLPTALNGGAIYGYSFNQPCFTTSVTDTFTQETIPITFNGSNANSQPYNYPDGGVPTPGPSGAPTTNSGDPCHSGEFETATISDTKGHTVKFYYEEQ